MEILSTVNLLIVIFLHTAHRQGMKKSPCHRRGDFKPPPKCRLLEKHLWELLVVLVIA